jgi:hypothetical protein
MGHTMDDVAGLNRVLESGADLPTDIWNHWLWHTDPAEPATVDCLLNKMQLMGLIIARYRALREPHLMNVVLTLPRIIHASVMVLDLTPRQLKDVVEDLQMHWNEYLNNPDLSDTLVDTVDACMTRFGEINLRHHAIKDVSMMDDRNPDRLNHTTIRRFVCIFLVLYRHLHMYHSCQQIESADTSHIETIQEFHVQASMESFYRHSMHMDLPPAARLLYRHEFAGFYNCISQVVYLHFPTYERRTQLTLMQIRSGTGISVHSLAPLMEMYPDIHLCYEDELLSENAWNWVIMGPRVYLVSPSQEIFYSTNLTTLLAHKEQLEN